MVRSILCIILSIPASKLTVSEGPWVDAVRLSSLEALLAHLLRGVLVEGVFVALLGEERGWGRGVREEGRGAKGGGGGGGGTEGRDEDERDADIFNAQDTVVW